MSATAKAWELATEVVDRIGRMPGPVSRIGEMSDGGVALHFEGPRKFAGTQRSIRHAVIACDRDGDVVKVHMLDALTGETRDEIPVCLEFGISRAWDHLHLDLPL